MEGSPWGEGGVEVSDPAGMTAVSSLWTRSGENSTIVLLPLPPLVRHKLFLHRLPDGLINRWYHAALVEERGSFMVEAVKAQDNAQLHELPTSVAHGGIRMTGLLIECRQHVL